MRASDLSESDKWRWGGPPGPRPTPPSACGVIQEPDAPSEERVQGDPRGPGGPPHRWSRLLTVVCTNVDSALDFSFIIKKFHFIPTCEMAHRRGNIPDEDFAYLSAPHVTESNPHVSRAVFGCLDYRRRPDGGGAPRHG